MTAPVATPAPDVEFDRVSAERAALEQAGQLHEVNAESIAHANQILALLVERVDPDWDKVMTKSLTEQEKALGLRSINAQRERLNLGEPVGAVQMSTEGARALTDLPPPVAQRAVQLLKGYGRLVQCGRGRGKCLVVLEATPVSEAVARAQRRPVAERMAQELEAADLIRILSTKTGGAAELLSLAATLIKAEREAAVEARKEVEAELAKVKKEASRRVTVRADAAKLRELATELRRVQRENSELRAVLESKEATIQQLENERIELQVSSWS